jgi:hypothetical protein
LDEQSKPTRAEAEILRANGLGEEVDLTTGTPSIDNPARAAKWDSGRTVRAGLLTELLTGARNPPEGPVRPLKLRGARILGQVNLESAVLGNRLIFEHCFFDQPINLKDADIPMVRLYGCHIPGLEATQLRTRGNLELGSLVCKGEVLLRGAHIGGELHMAGAKIINPGGFALAVDWATIGTNMVCQDGFSTRGQVSLNGARIGRWLLFDGASLGNPGDVALAASHLAIEQGMQCKDGFEVKGMMWLQGAHIGGPLDLSSARLANAGDVALHAGGISVGGEMSCEDGFLADGEIHLTGANIGGSLRLSGARLNNPGGLALSADYLQVGQQLICQHLAVTGEARIAGAHIVGQLQLDDARLDGSGGNALTADGITVDDAVFLCRGQFTGAVSMTGARFGEALDMRDAILCNPGGIALVGDRMAVAWDFSCQGLNAEGTVRIPYGSIGGTLYLEEATLADVQGTALAADQLTVQQSMRCDKLSAAGEIHMSGASVGGQLVFAGASLTNPGAATLTAEHLTVAHDILFRDGFKAEGAISLGAAQAGAIVEFNQVDLAGHGEPALNLFKLRADELRLFPAAGPDGSINLTDAQVRVFRDDPEACPAAILLDGFTYEVISAHADVRTRLRWLLRHQKRYEPQPYEQLVAAYRREGDERGARIVGIAKQRRRSTTSGPVGKLVSWILFATVGYGYRTWLAAVWLAVLIPLSSLMFSQIHMTAATSQPPVFNSLGYTLDLLLPVADFGLKNDWQPVGGYLYLTWLLRAIGWILTTAVVAATTGILKRD